ncbi:NADH:quinone oxidoreductase [Listeria monocytogenes]|nr:NADH:quinone oxidoreductase [Listeria monocytogenes]
MSTPKKHIILLFLVITATGLIGQLFFRQSHRRSRTV